MQEPQFGRLERHDLRDIWAHEERDFTPWLAKPENLAMLGETLGIEFELEAQEKSVGPFRADILCRDVGNDHWVLIENQLERTNHVHLGQLLTYASGLDAVTIIWVAADFTEEHRAALDWLNKVTNDSVRFFGLEVELWRIGNSSVAPKFNIVSKPNDWLHSIAQVVDNVNLTETRALQLDYWTALNTVLGQIGGPVMGNRKPQPQAWMSFPIGRTKFHLNAVMSRPRNEIRVELYIRGPLAKTFFRMLHDDKDAIEGELGYPLDWDELPDGQDSRVSCHLEAVNPEDRGAWGSQHEWLAKRLNDVHRVFARRIKSLEA